MNRILSAIAMILVLSSVLVAQETAAKPETVKFTAKNPAAGDQVVKGSTSDTTTVMTISMGEMGEQTMNQGVKMKETKTVTVLAAEGENVTKFKIAYKEVKLEQITESPMSPEPMTQDMMEGNNPSGNTYVFTIGESGVVITDEKGEAVTEGMAEFLKTAEAPEGKFVAWRPSAAEMFTAREFTIGETVVIPKDKAMAIIPNRKMLGNEVNIKVEATLRARKTVFGVACGVFDIVTTMDGSPAFVADNAPGMDMKMTMKLTGTMTIGIDNMWLYGMKSSGPLNVDAEIEAEEMSMTIKGSGTVTANMINVYSKAKIKAEEKK